MHGQAVSLSWCNQKIGYTILISATTESTCTHCMVYDLVVEAAFMSDRTYSEDLDTIHAHVTGLMLNNDVERVRNKSTGPGYQITLHL